MMAQALLDTEFEEVFERIQCFSDDLRHLRERWNNRRVLENRPIWETHFNGRAEIILYGNWSIGADHLNFAVCISAYVQVFHSIRTNIGVDIIDICGGDDRQEIVVLIIIAEARRGPEVDMPPLKVSNFAINIIMWLCIRIGNDFRERVYKTSKCVMVMVFHVDFF